MALILGDLGIKTGRAAKLGVVGEPGTEEIDLHGLAVAQGFVGVHTHYDVED